MKSIRKSDYKGKKNSKLTLDLGFRVIIFDSVKEKKEYLRDTSVISFD